MQHLIRRWMAAVVTVLVFGLLAFPDAVLHAATSPATPSITEPAVDGKVVNPGDVHMETSPFVDPDPGDAHRCTDWEIWAAGLTERVWITSCIGGVERLHTHLGDGVFQGSLQGKTALNPQTDYILRARHRDSSNDPATEWSQWATRSFRTGAISIGDPDNKWALRQPGYELEVVAGNLQMPVNIAFKPNAGASASAPYYYVTELYGTIKVVRRDGVMGDYATGLLNYNPSGNFPGSGEQGLTGIVVDPATGDVYAGMLYRATNGQSYPKVVRFTSTNGGLTAASQTTILDMVGEAQGQSHQISNLTIGPDGKLYVHMGDGFDSSKGQDLTSFRGKILRMSLDGSPASDNPFYSASDGITARDYVYAYGLRNPFGGAWRQADGAHYEVSNGPTVDRWSKVAAGRNYGYDGSDTSMRNFAIQAWASTGPVNIAFVQAGTFGGSQFPAAKQGRVYLSHSGCTYCSGPGNKRIDEWALNADGTYQSGPVNLLEYTGTGKATVVGLAAGPDGLYFSDFYKDAATAPTERGANIYRLRYVGIVDFSASPTAGSAPLSVQFSDLSSVLSPTAWSWDFGDGTGSGEQNPRHTYTAAGTYNVQLTVTGASGNRATLKSGLITVSGSGGPTATPTRTGTRGPTATPTRTGIAGSTITPTRTGTPTTTGGCGGTNLALSRPATASSTDDATNRPASRAVDGSTTTRWSSAYGDPQWLQVDLGSSQSICRVRLSWEVAYGRAYEIQTSNDAASWTTIFSTTTGAGGIEDLTVSGSGRYVRMYGTARATQWGYSLWELEIYGGTAQVTATPTRSPSSSSTSTPTQAPTAVSSATPTRTATPQGTPVSCGTSNLALNRPATSSSTDDATNRPASRAVDGSTTTRWSSAYGDPQWLQVDLGTLTSICRVRLSWEVAYGRAYRIETSNDAASWTTIYTTTTGDGGVDDLTVSGSGRYVRMYGTGRATQWGYSLWELELFGS